MVKLKSKTTLITSKSLNNMAQAYVKLRRTLTVNRAQSFALLDPVQISLFACM